MGKCSVSVQWEERKRTSVPRAPATLKDNLEASAGLGIGTDQAYLVPVQALKPGAIGPAESNCTSSLLACPGYFRMMLTTAPGTLPSTGSDARVLASLPVDTCTLRVALWCHPEVPAPILKLNWAGNSAKMFRGHICKPLPPSLKPKLTNPPPQAFAQVQVCVYPSAGHHCSPWPAGCIGGRYSSETTTEVSCSMQGIACYW